MMGRNIMHYQSIAWAAEQIIIIIIINIRLLKGCSTTRGKQAPIGHVTLWQKGYCSKNNL